MIKKLLSLGSHVLTALVVLAMGSLAIAQSSGTRVTILGATGNGALVNSSGALEVDATITPSGTQNVNVAQVAGATVATGSGTAAGSLRVELPTNGTGVIATVGAVTAITNALPAGSQIIGNVRIDQTTPGTTNGVVVNAGTTGATPVPAVSAISTVSATVTRPTDTNAYAANDAFANSTSAPTAGGFTLTSACRASGGYGTIQDAVITASAGTAYQGEVWVFDQAVTAINDNAAFTITDGEAQTLVGVIPFNTADVTAANAISYVTGLDIGYTCVGTANLRFLVKIMAAVTPGNAEVLSFRIKVVN